MITAVVQERLESAEAMDLASLLTAKTMLKVGRRSGCRLTNIGRVHPSKSPTDLFESSVFTPNSLDYLSSSSNIVHLPRS